MAGPSDGGEAHDLPTAGRRRSPHGFCATWIWRGGSDDLVSDALRCRGVESCRPCVQGVANAHSSISVDPGFAECGTLLPSVVEAKLLDLERRGVRVAVPRGSRPDTRRVFCVVINGDSVSRTESANDCRPGAGRRHSLGAEC